MRQAIERGLTDASRVTVAWSDSRDARVRDLHRAMNGQTRRFGEPFVSPTGALLRYPGDVSLGASGEDVVNCRCFAAITVDWLAQAA